MQLENAASKVREEKWRVSHIHLWRIDFMELREMIIKIGNKSG